MPNTKALSELQRRLMATQSLANYKPWNDISLYRAFNITGAAYKGQLTTGFGERGTKLSLDVSWNFGDLILPGVVTAELTAGASGQKSDYVLTFLARQPKKMEGYSTTKPVCFGILSGYAAAASVKAGITAGVDIACPLTDELGLSVSASANADLGGRLIQLRDASLGFYESDSDSALAADFEEELDALVRRQLKNMVDAWLAEHEKPGTAAKFAAAVQEAKEFREEHSDLFDSTASADGEESTDAAVPVAPANAPTLSGAANLFKRAKAYLMPPKSADLLTRLKALQEALTKDRADLEPTEKEDQDRMDQELRLIGDYTKAVERIQAIKMKTAAAPAPRTKASAVKPRKASYLNLWVLDGGAGVGAEAGLKIGAIGSAGVEVNASARANMITFRFQTEGSRRGILITEDTVLHYREADAKALAELKINVKAFEKSAEKTFCYRSMIYHSAVVYWQSSFGTVQPLPGSGIRFGMGVNVEALLDLLKALAPPKDPAAAKVPLDEPHKSLLDRICTHLRVTQEEMEAFLDPKELDFGPKDLPADVVLLEAGFALPSSFGGLIWKKAPSLFGNEPGELNDTLAALSTAMKSRETLNDAKLELHVLRLRFRISDTRDRSDSVFKLGFSFIAGAEFSVDKIKTSDHEGIVDLKASFFNGARNPAPVEGSGAATPKPPEFTAMDEYERAVPPVSLLHH